MTARVFPSLLQMGRLRPRPHGDVSRATEQGHSKAQPLRLAEQEDSHATQSSQDTTPWRKERQTQRDRVSNIAQLTNRMPVGRTQKDKRIKVALFYLSPRASYLLPATEDLGADHRNALYFKGEERLLHHPQPIK